MTRALFASLALTTFASLQACTVKSDEDRFREAIPENGDVAIDVPAGKGGNASTQGGVSILSDPTAGGSTARYYAFTLAVTAGVDVTTLAILGSVRALVSLTPTTLEKDKATWGPSQPKGLEAAQWRFVVKRVAEDEYDYALEGRPKASSTEADYAAVVSGHGWGDGHPNHRTGFILVNRDAWKKLQPGAVDPEGGTVRISFDGRKSPATINAELRPTPARGSLDIGVVHELSGAGKLTIKGTADVNALKNTKLENVELASRWDASGAGRSDVTLTGGDVPVASVTATECWNSLFQSSYYKDSADYEPSHGQESDCSVAK